MFVDQLVLTPPPAANTWCGDAYPDVITTAFDEGENDTTPDDLPGVALTAACNRGL